MKAWDIIKLAGVLAFIALVLRVVFSPKYFGELPAEYFYLMLAIVAAFIVYTLIRYLPVVGKFRKPKSHRTNMRDVVTALAEEGDTPKATIDDKDGMTHHPEWDISSQFGPQGDSYFFQFRQDEPTGKITRNVFFDAARGVIRAEIRGDPLGERPMERLKNAAVINTLLKSGVAPSVTITPKQIEEIRTIVEKG